MQLRILYRDDYLVAVDKPARMHVHPPEDPTIPMGKGMTCLKALKAQLGRYIYPVHRLDYATAGALLFALDSETAGELARGFRERTVNKTYFAVVRGWVKPGLIERPLSAENDPSVKIPARTQVEVVAQIELPFAVGRYTTARYSLIRAEPETGRFHQIRRHLAGASHPLIGDSVYGDGEHNRFFRDQLDIPGLLLKAQCISFAHPRSREPLRIESRWAGKWHRVFERFGVCPFSK